MCQKLHKLVDIPPGYYAAARDSESGFMQRPVHLLSVCLSVAKLQNAIFSKTQQFKAMVFIDDP